MPEPTTIEELEEELNSADERPSSVKNGVGGPGVHDDGGNNNQDDEAEEGENGDGYNNEDDSEEDEKKDASGDDEENGGGDEDNAQPVQERLKLLMNLFENGDR